MEDWTKQKLRESGLKVTATRCVVLQVLQDCHSHLTVEALFEAVRQQQPAVGLSSIYRNLLQLEQVGLVLRNQFQDVTSYELNLNEHHDHLICTGCDKVVEFVDMEVERRQHQIAKKHQFKLQTHVMNLYGLCQDCQAAK